MNDCGCPAGVPMWPVPSSGNVHVWDAQYSGNPGVEFLDPAVADITLTYAQLQPEAWYSLVDTQRTGKLSWPYQDLNSLAANNINWLNAYYNRNAAPPTRGDDYGLLLNILSSPDLGGK